MTILEKATGAAIETLQRLWTLESLLIRAADAVGACLTEGGKLLVCGNGGSAADGADFATEFVCRFVEDRRPYPAINLGACGSLLTAVGNDYGYEQVFARSVRAFAQPKDLLVAISTSGNSPSILAALQAGRESGICTIALLGRDGGKAKGVADIELIVPGTATARIQEAHKFLLHVLCEIAEENWLKAHRELIEP